ncbi:UNVERIFIED_CONTAM: hypothetical protein HDU68_002727 [Siphonaria sp. JEL0065]|nr:hypothetical protein HDU68_002727 [Siphonaria sp. JEL0065]
MQVDTPPPVPGTNPSEPPTGEQSAAPTPTSPTTVKRALWRRLHLTSSSDSELSDCECVSDSPEPKTKAALTARGLPRRGSAAPLNSALNSNRTLDVGASPFLFNPFNLLARSPIDNSFGISVTANGYNSAAAALAVERAYKEWEEVCEDWEKLRDKKTTTDAAAPTFHAQTIPTIPSKQSLSSSAPPTASFISDDNCSTCFGRGELLCCDSCPRVFHFCCVQEGFSVDGSDTPSFWECKKCVWKRNNNAPYTPEGAKSKRQKVSSASITASSSSSPTANTHNPAVTSIKNAFSLLNTVVEAHNPRVFELPASLYNAYQGVYKHPLTGDYIDLHETEVVLTTKSTTTNTRRTTAAVAAAAAAANNNEPNIATATSSSSATLTTEDWTQTITRISGTNANWTSESIYNQFNTTNAPATTSQPSFSIPSILTTNTTKTHTFKKSLPLCYSCSRPGPNLSTTTTPTPEYNRTSDLVKCDHCDAWWHMDCLLPTPLTGSLPGRIRAGFVTVSLKGEGVPVGEIGYASCPPAGAGGAAGEDVLDLRSVREMKRRLWGKFGEDFGGDGGSRGGVEREGVYMRKRWMCPLHVEAVVGWKRKWKCVLGVEVLECVDDVDGVVAVDLKDKEVDNRVVGLEKQKNGQTALLNGAGEHAAYESESMDTETVELAKIDAESSSYSTSSTTTTTFKRQKLLTNGKNDGHIIIVNDPDYDSDIDEPSVYANATTPPLSKDTFPVKMAAPQRRKIRVKADPSVLASVVASKKPGWSGRNDERVIVVVPLTVNSVSMGKSVAAATVPLLNGMLIKKKRGGGGVKKEVAKGNTPLEVGLEIIDADSGVVAGVVEDGTASVSATSFESVIDVSVDQEERKEEEEGDLMNVAVSVKTDEDVDTSVGFGDVDTSDEPVVIVEAMDIVVVDDEEDVAENDSVVETASSSNFPSMDGGLDVPADHIVEFPAVNNGNSNGLDGLDVPSDATNNPDEDDDAVSENATGNVDFPPTSGLEVPSDATSDGPSLSEEREELVSDATATPTAAAAEPEVEPFSAEPTPEQELCQSADDGPNKPETEGQDEMMDWVNEVAESPAVSELTPIPLISTPSDASSPKIASGSAGPKPRGRPKKRKGPNSGSPAKFKCKVKGCAKSFPTEWHLNRHNNVHATNPEFVCTFCNKPFQSQYHLERHAKSHESGYWKCLVPGCDKVFDGATNLNTHKQRAHELGLQLTQEPGLVNAESVSVTPSEDAAPVGTLTTAIPTSTTITPLKFVCQVQDCGKLFATHFNLTKHFRAIHPQLEVPKNAGRIPQEHTRYPCTYAGCTKVCPGSWQLERHLRSHQFGRLKKEPKVVDGENAPSTAGVSDVRPKRPIMIKIPRVTAAVSNSVQTRKVSVAGGVILKYQFPAVLRRMALVVKADRFRLPRGRYNQEGGDVEHLVPQKTFRVDFEGRVLFDGKEDDGQWEDIADDEQATFVGDSLGHGVDLLSFLVQATNEVELLEQRSMEEREIIFGLLDSRLS